MKKIITLAFDDGWHSQHKYGLPILNQYGYKGTFYIITQYLKQQGEKRMSLDEVIELSNTGHEIGAHTVTHPNLQLKFWKAVEIKQSKQDLEAHGFIVKSFAYPFGRYNKFIEKQVQLAGYYNARAVKGDFNAPETSKWEICCKAVVKNTTPEKVQEWMDEALKNDYWLVLLFHQIDPHPYQYGCTPEMFQAVCDIVKSSNATVLPISEAYKEYFKAL